MKYRIEASYSSYVVKVKGKIVFRGTHDQCVRWCQDAVNFDRDCAMEGR
jgi:hypothetical protein